jgi:hypothetical protein
MSSRRTRAWYLATASVVAVASASHSLASGFAAPLDDDDLFLVSLKLGNLILADSITAYNTPTGLCLDLAQTLNALDFPIDVDPHAGFARGWFLREDQVFSLDARKKRLEIGSKKIDLADSDVRETADGLCVSITALKRWFPINFDADLPNAVVKLISREPLPIEQQIERRARQVKLQRVSQAEYLSTPAQKIPYQFFRPPAVDITTEFTAEREAGQATLRTKRQYTVLAAGEIAKLSSEIYLSSDISGVPQDLRGRLYRRSTDANLLGKLRATEFVVGDVSGRSSSLIAEPEAGRGASITNIPLDAPQTFDRTTFRGDIPDGWEVELYRNGQLSSFLQSTANGRYEFRDVPLVFGLNNFQIIAYGPQGQIKREQRSVTVGPQAVPPGKFWYAAGAYEAGRNLVTLARTNKEQNVGGPRAFASLQYGAAQSTTLSLNLESLEFRKRQHNYLEIGAVQTLGPIVAGATGTIDFQGGQAVELLAFGNTLGMDLSTRHALFNKYQSQRISDSIKSRHALRAYAAPVLFGRPLPTTLELVYDRRRNAPDLIDISHRTNWSISGLLFAHDARFTSNLGRTARSADTRWINALLWSTGWNDFRVRGEVNYRLTQGVAVERMNIGVDWYQSENMQVRGQADWTPSTKAWRMGLGLNRMFDVFTLGARAEVGNRGAVVFGLNLATGLSLLQNNAKNRHSWQLSRHRPALTGAASIHVFEDINDNGKQDGEERAIAGVGFGAGAAMSENVSNARGIVNIHALRPFAIQSIAVDQATLPDATYRARNNAISVNPRPGISENYEFPIYPTGDVDGTVRVKKGDETIAAGGAKIQIVNADGKIVASGLSDLEGYFVIEGLKFGRYALRIDPEQAKLLGFKTNTMRLIEITNEKPSLSSQDLTLMAADIQIAEAAPRLMPIPLWAN